MAIDIWSMLYPPRVPKVGSGTFETGFPPARFAAVWPLTLLAFGRYRRILHSEPPKQCQVEPFLAGWSFESCNTYPLVNKVRYVRWPFMVDFPIENGDFP